MITWMKAIISKLFNEVLNLGTNMKAQFFNCEGLNSITIDRLAELDRNRTGPDKPVNHPTIHRPFELAHGFQSPYESGDVGLEQGNVEQTRMISHNRIALFQLNIFTPFRFDLDEQNLEQESKVFFDP